VPHSTLSKFLAHPQPSDVPPRSLPRTRLLTSNESLAMLEEKENKKKESEEKERCKQEKLEKKRLREEAAKKKQEEKAKKLLTRLKGQKKELPNESLLHRPEK